MKTEVPARPGHGPVGIISCHGWASELESFGRSRRRSVGGRQRRSGVVLRSDQIRLLSSERTHCARRLGWADGAVNGDRDLECAGPGCSAQRRGKARGCSVAHAIGAASGRHGPSAALGQAFHDSPGRVGSQRRPREADGRRRSRFAPGRRHLEAGSNLRTIGTNLPANRMLRRGLQLPSSLRSRRRYCATSWRT
jgi:hypothetical protein